VAQPGSPPKWVGGSNLCLVVIQVRSSAMHEERILDIVSSRAMGAVCFGGAVVRMTGFPDNNCFGG